MAICSRINYGLFSSDLVNNASTEQTFSRRQCSDAFGPDATVTSPFKRLFDVCFASTEHLVVIMRPLPLNLISLQFIDYFPFIAQNCNRPKWLSRDFPLTLFFDEFVMRYLMHILRHDMQHFFSTKDVEFPDIFVFHGYRATIVSRYFEESLFCDECACLLAGIYECFMKRESWMLKMEDFPWCSRIYATSALNFAELTASNILHHRRGFFCDMCNKALFHLTYIFSHFFEMPPPTLDNLSFVNVKLRSYHTYLPLTCRSLLDWMDVIIEQNDYLEQGNGDITQRPKHQIYDSIEAFVIAMNRRRQILLSSSYIRTNVFYNFEGGWQQRTSDQSPIGIESESLPHIYGGDEELCPQSFAWNVNRHRMEYIDDEEEQQPHDNSAARISPRYV